MLIKAYVAFKEFIHEFSCSRSRFENVPTYRNTVGNVIECQNCQIKYYISMSNKWNKKLVQFSFPFVPL